MDNNNISLKEILTNFETDLQIPNGFLEKILKEDTDWAFVIKIHTLLESATSFHIAKELNRSDLARYFSKYDMKERIDFIKELGTLDKKARMFLRKLSELRNVVAHDIKMINFKLKEYFETLDSNQKNYFIDALGYGVKDETEINSQKITKINLITAAPRLAIWFSCLAIIETIYFHHKFKIEAAKLDQFYNEFGKFWSDLLQKAKNKNLTTQSSG